MPVTGAAILAEILPCGAVTYVSDVRGHDEYGLGLIFGSN